MKLLLYLIALSPLFSQEILNVKLIRCSDGDSFHALHNKKEIQVRIHGIDAPELMQSGGFVARAYLKLLLKDNKIRLKIKEIDKYGRYIAHVTVNKQDIAQHMIHAGWAWHFIRYAPNDKKLALAEKQAKKKLRGIWGFDSVAPWL